MAVNLDKPHLWKNDIAQSVDFYNDWFMEFAPKAFRDTRIQTTEEVKSALQWTENLTNIKPEVLRKNPSILSILRMATCPPIARGRLIGLAGVSSNLVQNMEIHNRLSPSMDKVELTTQLEKISEIIDRMSDPDIFVWKGRDIPGTEDEVNRAATIVADRLCGAVANPIIRNAQERRQLASIQTWLEARGYRQLKTAEAEDFMSMPPGTFAFRLNVPVKLGRKKKVNIPVDLVIMRKRERASELPLLVEAKSAGDFTNVNKRRKEAAVKMAQLRQKYNVRAIPLRIF